MTYEYMYLKKRDFVDMAFGKDTIRMFSGSNYASKGKFLAHFNRELLNGRIIPGVVAKAV